MSSPANRHTTRTWIGLHLSPLKKNVGCCHLPLPIFEPTDDEGIPERIHFCAAVVHDLREKLVYFHRTQLVSVICSDLLDRNIVEHSLNVLKIGHVSACADDGTITNGVETLHVLEAGERAV